MGVGKSIHQDKLDSDGEELFRSIANRKSNTGIDYRARILQRIDSEKLWNNFLSSSSGAFMISKAELTSLLKLSIKVCLFKSATI